MSARAGLQQIALSDLSTMSGTPTNLEFIGLGGEKKVEITEHNPVDIFPEKKGRNMQLHKVEGVSTQCTMKMLKNMIGFLNGNVDTQVITAKQSASANSEDVFKYLGNDGLGLGFKYASERKSHLLTATLQRAFDYEYSKTLKDAVDTATPISFTGVTDLGGRDFSLYDIPNKLIFEVGGSEPFVPINLKERSLILETIESGKNEHEMPDVDLLKALIRIVANEATIDKIVTMMAKANSSVVSWKESTSGLYYKKYDFNVNVLTQSEPKEVFGDKERMFELEFQGAEWIYNTQFLFGTGNGGSAADTVGTTGGTMKFGY